ncbi:MULTISPECIES: hypothetical protein [Nocardioides]|uniref:Uncharacterized protein n=1 Tax=Nocardioides vastitatis TaxID=2568655 RepID=A0ABW0ZRB5_9ACTN|nr:hypothetical protein [Nocardioides sp.]THI96074.1 hypothetical protein E7Z54_17840 [Nocardioides sp.]
MNDRREQPEANPPQEREPEWKRQQRLAEIFGDVLPSVTSDERDDAPPTKDDSAADQWLKAQVPPHHG